MAWIFDKVMSTGNGIVYGYGANPDSKVENDLTACYMNGSGTSYGVVKAELAITYQYKWTGSNPPAQNTVVHAVMTVTPSHGHSGSGNWSNSSNLSGPYTIASTVGMIDGVTVCTFGMTPLTTPTAPEAHVVHDTQTFNWTANAGVSVTCGTPY